MPRKTRRKIQAARARFRAWIFLSSREQVTYTPFLFLYQIMTKYLYTLFPTINTVSKSKRLLMLSSGKVKIV
jgi:hypothetical protein